MGFITVTPPKNAQYVAAYNQLIEGCWRHGFGMTLPKKSVVVPVSVLQSDLQTIRNALMTEAKSIYFVANLLDLSLEDPFDEEDVRPEFNDGKGFLMMPGAYTSTGRNVYSADSFDGQKVPVLWEHFTDLAAIINSLVTKKADYFAKLTIDVQKLSMDVTITRGEDVSDSHGERTYNSGTRKSTETWDISYTSTTPYDYDAGNTFDFYYHLTDCEGVEDRDWQVLSGFLRADLMSLDVNKIVPAIKANSPEAAEWIGYCHLQPVCHIKFKVKLEHPAIYPDEEQNGVAQEGCVSCCTLISNKYNYLKNSIGRFSGRVDFPLAISNDPLQIGHFMAKFPYAGTQYGQYNCDTCIEDEFYADTFHDEEDDPVSWRFCFLRRPTGAMVPFYWKDGDDGIPMNGFTYRMERSQGGGYRLRFPSGYRHVFTGTTLSSCQYEGGAERLTTTIPGSFVERTSSGALTYTFKSPTTGEVQLVVDARSVPKNQYNNSENSMLRSRIRTLEEEEVPETPASELIREVRTSESLEDAAGFDFADFFPTGQAPEFGEEESCSIVEFYNPQELLTGKYIEMNFDSGILAKGFWNREGNELVPAELSMFERTPQEENVNQFLEKQTVVKYSSNGRNQAVTYRMKENFQFGEMVIAEYRNYEDEEERLESVFEYGTVPGSGNFGKPTFTKDFNGTWTRYEYDALGRQTKLVTPFLDATEESAESLCRVVSYDYTPLSQQEEVFAQDMRPRTVVTKVLDTEISREYHLYFEHEAWDIRAAAPGALWNATGNLVTKTYSYSSGDFAGKYWKTENSDGTVSVASYEKINIQQDGSYDLKTTIESGFLTDMRTREITVRDMAGNIVSRNVFDIPSTLQTAGSVYTYDQFGRVLTETTLDGDVTETEYNCCGPRFVTAPNGTVTEYAYDVFNRLRFENVAGVTTFHTYDARDNEIETNVTGRDEGELVTIFTYDADGLLVSRTDPDEAVTTYLHGPCFEQTANALGGTSRVEIYLDGQTKQISGTAAIPKTYEYGLENGELYSKEIASATEWVKTRTDFLGRTYEKIYPDSFTETTLYDSFGRVEATENSDDLKIINVYNAISGKLQYRVVKRTPGSTVDWNADQITEFDDGYRLRGTVTVIRYQETFLRFSGVETLVSVSETSRDGKQTWTTQNGQTTHTARVFGPSDGEMVETATNFDGSTLVNTYQDGILTLSESSVLGETEYVYDEFNRPTGNDHTEGSETVGIRYTLDAMGRWTAVTQTVDTLERVTAYTYDALGNKLTETTPEEITTTYTYTARGELATVSGGTYQQEYAYDDQGRMTSLMTWQDSNTPATTEFSYDNRGRLAEKTYPDDTSETYTYRGDGRIATMTNVRGQVHTYTYNRAGELLNIEVTSLFEREYAYDPNGRMTGVTDATGTTELAYDIYGKILSETFPSPSGTAIVRSFDTLQRPSGISLGSTPLAAYTYGTDGRLATLENGTAILSYAYHLGTDQIASRSWQIGQNTPFLVMGNSFDDYSRLVEISANNVAEIAYTLNDDNQRTAAALNDGSSWAYGYDTKGQLLTAVREDSQSTTLNDMTYAYDGIGNRTEIEEDTVEKEYTSNLLNQYTSIETTSETPPITESPTYDADGNMLTNGPWTYTWNTESRLTSATSGTTVLEFQYDYMGRRVEKKVTENSIVTKQENYVYDGYKLIAIYDALNSNALLMTFVWQPIGLDVPLCMTYSGNTYYYLTDGNKNVTGLFDSTGTRVASYLYGPFGQILSSTGAMATINPFRFSSEFHDDETDLVYYNYRYYSPVIGRWTRRDPIETSHRFDYIFVANAPIHESDRLGLQQLMTFTATNRVVIVTPPSPGLRKQVSGANPQNTYVEMQKIYIDASLTESPRLLEELNILVPKGIPVYNAGRVSNESYLGAGFIAKFVQDENCPLIKHYHWEQQVTRYIEGTTILWKKTLDYRFPQNHPYAVDFSGDSFSGIMPRSIHREFRTRLINDDNNQVLFTIYWSVFIDISMFIKEMKDSTTVSLNILW